MPNQGVFFDNSKPMDATVKIYLSKDLLEARMEITPPANGGAEATPVLIDKALQSAHIKYGIDAQKLQEIKASPQYSTPFVIARGVAAQDGVDGTIRYHFKLNQKISPKLREDNTVDYRDLNLIENVKKGQVLCTLTLPTPGSGGTTVTGQKILQIKGRAVPSPLGQNTEFNPEGTTLVASTDGQVKYEYQKVDVYEVFTVQENVDHSTGNIKFIGSVHVRGNILEDFVVEAGGNVEVDGIVDGGIIHANGDIVIHRGVVGRERSELICSGDLKSTFLESCRVTAGGNVCAESVMSSHIVCSGTITVTGLRAKLIGGRCVAGVDISADVIGSPSNIPTELVLGADPSMVARRDKLSKELRELNADALKLSQIITLLTQYQQAGRLKPEKYELLEKSRLSLEQIQAKIQGGTEEMQTLTAYIEGADKGKVVCRQIIYRGVRITIGLASMQIDEPAVHASFYCEDGSIKSGTV